jgi:hypothetical protein
MELSDNSLRSLCNVGHLQIQVVFCSREDTPKSFPVHVTTMGLVTSPSATYTDRAYLFGTNVRRFPFE